MSKLLAVVGIVGTVLYLTFVVWARQITLTELSALSLNELGDFLAGAFGPLAIFWLILGFFQQGKELQLNTRALELQADELRQSVEQQRELVEVTRKQVDADIQAISEERARLEREARANFLFYSKGSGKTSARVSYTFRFINAGAQATSIYVTSTSPIMRINPAQIPVWERGQVHQIDFDIEDIKYPETIELSFAYIDGRGAPSIFNVQLQNESGTYNYDYKSGSQLGS